MKETGRLVLTFAIGLVVGNVLPPSPAVQAPGAGDSQLVTGIGGVFFKADDSARLRAWYRDHLRHRGRARARRQLLLARTRGSGAIRPHGVVGVSPGQFGGGRQSAMVNYRVRDLDALLARLRAQGVEQVGGVDEYWYGRFAWIRDGEGNRVELWQPVSSSPEEFERRQRREEAR